MTSMDRTERDVENALRGLRPDVVFFDFAHWVPKLARSLGIKAVYFGTASPVFVSFCLAAPPGKSLEPPRGFPDPSIKLRRHELRYFTERESHAFGSSIKLPDRLRISATECDAYASRGCREKRLGREVPLVGPLLPEDSPTALDPRWGEFLSGFESGSAVYCSLGSQQKLSLDQFRELVLGLELSGRPFLSALKPPVGARTVDEALPEGFRGRVGARGSVLGSWIKQQMVLEHPAVGLFVTHCGYGSLMEGIAAGCQLVMVPFESDQFFNARLIATRLRAGVEVERNQDDGSFTREGVCEAIRAVSGEEIRLNFAKLREILLRDGLESSYVDDFSRMLQSLVAKY